MSVLIKDMEKPKSCYAVINGESEYCPFVNTDDDCVLLLKKGRCDGTWEEQYSKCPLIETAEPSQVARDIATIIQNEKDMRVIEQNDIIACGDCKHWICHDKRCGYWNHGVKPLDWCCHAERRTDEQID